MNVSIATTVQSIGAVRRVTAVANSNGHKFELYKDIRSGTDFGQVRDQLASKLAQRLALLGISVTAVEHIQ